MMTDKKADLAGPGISTYEQVDKILPHDYEALGSALELGVNWNGWILIWYDWHGSANRNESRKEDRLGCLQGVDGRKGRTEQKDLNS